MLKIKSGKDLSGGLTPDIFDLKDLARFGMNGGISALAFDPIQSLLIAGTDTGSVYVFGQPGVEYRFQLCPGKPIIFVKIVRGLYIVSVDGNNNVTIVSMESKHDMRVYTPPERVTAIECDPSLDWAWIGMENGLTMVYDVDRGTKSPYRIENLQRTILPTRPRSPVVFIALNPRVVQTILIGYQGCAAVYNMETKEILLALQFQIPVGAPGGDLHPAAQQRIRFPQLTTGVWHPNGHHICTAYDDGSIVFWDAKDGTLLQARTLDDTEVNISRRSLNLTSPQSYGPQDVTVREPIYKMAWCCTSNPEDTALVVAGGESSAVPVKGLTYMEFGPTPVVQITSYQAMGDHYAQPRRQRIYPVPPGFDPVDFMMIPRSSPHYAGNMDPVALITILSSGELYSIEYPSGSALPVADMFPPSLCWIQPRVSALTVSSVRIEQWIGMMSARKNRIKAASADGLPLNVSRDEPILTGGIPVHSRYRRMNLRDIIISGHSDGSVRLWDASHGEIENSQVLDISIPDALGRSEDIWVTGISFAGQMGEVSVALITGEMVYFRFGLNRPPPDAISTQQGDMPISAATLAKKLNDLHLNGRPEGSQAPPLRLLTGFVDPRYREGFLPVLVLDVKQGPITCLKNSDIGFVAIGYEFGSVAVIELRSNTLIYLEPLVSLGLESGKKFPIRVGERSSQPTAQIEKATCLEFSVMALDGDQYSSIVLSIGTALGRVLTFRIIPSRSGTHSVQFMGVTTMKGPVISLIPIDLDYGVSAIAAPTILSKLPQGLMINGAVIVVSTDEARVIKPVKARVSSKSFDEKVVTAGLSLLRQGDTLVLVCVTEAGWIRVYSLPGLREVSHFSVQKFLDLRYIKQSVVSLNGDIILGIGKYEAALFNIWGKTLNSSLLSKGGEKNEVELYDVMKRMPPRPTISNVQWIAGSRYLTPEAFDILIGGPHRPKSARQIEEERARREQERLDATQKLYSQSSASSSRSSSFLDKITGSSNNNNNNSGYASERRDSYGNGYTRDPYRGNSLPNEAQERGEQIGFMSQQFSKLEDASNEYAQTISNFLEDQKKSVATSYFKSKFF
ncbi:lethal giant larvae like, C-terminal-domain-containing protein [Lipomyces oligophaga]|uniref:lethal giant larvae like, C-terminal-domain-containing protein n=1 Tax=Lipomyces oligophaga TaxID=45792 RepID=UPI0034D00BB8